MDQPQYDPLKQEAGLVSPPSQLGTFIYLFNLVLVFCVSHFQFFFQIFFNFFFFFFVLHFLSFSFFYSSQFFFIFDIVLGSLERDESR
jgi:hypothetical protein